MSEFDEYIVHDEPEQKEKADACYLLALATRFPVGI